MSPDVKIAMEAKKRKRGEERKEKQREQVERSYAIEKKRKAAIHHGLRGWSEEPPSEVPSLPADLVDRMDVQVDLDDQHEEEKRTLKPSLSLRIFGRAQQQPSASPTDGTIRGQVSSDPSLRVEVMNDDYEEDPWGLDTTLDYVVDAGLSQEPTNALTQSDEFTLAEKARLREKLLGKLLKEKRTSARARAVLSRPNVSGEDEVAERLAAADDGTSSIVPVDKEAIEARAKARLKLKLKLAKERASMEKMDVDATVDGGQPAAGTAVGLEVTDGQDRAAMLRAKLIAARKQ